MMPNIKTTDQRRKDMAARQTEELKRLGLMDSVIANSLPEMGLEFDSILDLSPHSYGADAFICLEAADLSEAITMAEKLNPETMIKKKRGGTSFLPLPFVEAIEKHEGSPDPGAVTVGPYIYKISAKSYSREKTLICYVATAAHMIEVRIAVLDDPDTRITYNVKRYMGGQRIENWQLVNKSGHFNQSVKWWSTDDQPADATLYVG